MPIVDYRWFPLGTDYLAIELLVTLLVPTLATLQLWNSMDPENINWQKAGYWKRLVLTCFVYLLDFFSYLIELKLCEGRAEVMESYRQTVKERCALIKDMHMNWSSSARVLSDSME